MCVLAPPALSQKYLVLETRKDGTKFTSRALKDAAERLTGAAAEYEALQKDLVEQVGSVCCLTGVHCWLPFASHTEALLLPGSANFIQWLASLSGSCMFAASG